MPNIIINEVDLTKAALQPSSTDIAFVPGLSCLSNATSDLTYCDSIAVFEEKFGTYPAIIDLYRVYNNASGTVVKEKYTITNKETFENNFYLQLYKNSIYKRVSKYSGTLSGVTQLVLGFDSTVTEANITSYLTACGLTSSDDQFDRTGLTTVYLDFDYDMSYVYAKELIMMGIPVIYKVLNPTTSSYPDMLSALASYFTTAIDDLDGILDKGEYSIKYVTSGSYPSFGYKVTTVSNSTTYSNASVNFHKSMAALAAKRGDCVALVDPADCSTTDLARNLAVEQMINPDNIFGAAEALCNDFVGSEFTSMFVPWILYSSQALYVLNNSSNSVMLPQLDSIIMPPSFAYLVTLAKSIRINNNWLAVAGIARGQVPYIDGLYTTKRLSNTLANYYQPRNGKTSINAITDIKPYGLTIWGNRTMKNNLNNAMGGKDGLTATSFLNIRNMVSDVKKTAYVAAKTLMFEQNSDVLWVNFLSRVTPFLDQLMSGQGLSDYKVIKNPTNEKAKLKATIKLYPIYAVEDFEITIELSDQDVSVI